MATEDQPVESTTTIPVPSSLRNTTPALPPLTSHLLVQHLRETNSIPALQSALSDSLARTGWTDRVRALALELLRNGECETFPELFEEVGRRVKIPRNGEEGAEADEPRSKTGGKSVPGATTPSTHQQQNGANAANANGAIAVREGWFGPDGLPDVRIPERTVQVGIEFLRDRIKDSIEVVEDA